jgi:PhzF family phenazine biosynthesis protein
MRLDIFQIDAFTDRLFAGNPAAVVLCENELSGKLMQSIAAENNLAETAFVTKKPDRLAIRWFTPTVEVDLCGHATLAAAHVLFEHQGVAGSLLSFESRSGMLRVHKIDDGLWLDFPTDRFVRENTTPEELIKGLGIEPRELYRGRDDYLAILDSEDFIQDLSLDQAALTTLARLPVRGVIVSAPGNEVDFISRFFAPQCGIPEDPVTGSAHTTLIPYWSNRLGKKKMKARQLSARGGSLLCEDHGDRVMIGGSAVTYLKGEIYV